MALSLSAIFKQLTGNGTYDPGAQARAALQSSNSSMVKSMFSPTPAAPAPAVTPQQNFQNFTKNAPVASTPAPGPTGSATGPIFGGGDTGGVPGPTGSTGSPIPSAWIKPDGGFYTPDEVAANIAKSAQFGAGPAAGNGDIPQYAGNLLTQGPQSAEQLQAAAAMLRNASNDLSTGTTDPYKVASQSGIAYTPAEMDAIEKAYAGIYTPAINTALAKLDAKQKEDAQNNQPFTLSKDQVRYDKDGNVIATGTSSTSSSDYLPGGVYTPGTNATVDAWAQRIANSQAKITDIPASDKGLRSAVQIALSSSGNNFTGGPTTTATGKQALTAAQAVLKQFVDNGGQPSVGTSRIFGGGLALPGSQSADFKIAFKNLKDLLSLDSSKLLQGQGQISDSERALLASAAAKIDLNQSEGEFKNSLVDIINKLSGVDAQSTNKDGSITTPDGKKWTQLPDGSYQEVSFNSVGNTTASGNVPQRNNNPGNIKKGGIADKYAVGTDRQGHLIFPDDESGFKALQDDLSAKINGNSRHVKANPTIAELGKVYAEDPAWGKKVASLLGVPVTMNTKSIPIAALAKAIATQEGYFA